MPNLRILAVEDDRVLLGMIANSLSSNERELVWASILGSQHNQFDDLIVSTAPTIDVAQKLISNHPRFHLFILDISVKNSDSSMMQGNGLELISYAISAGKKPSAIVSLTGTSMDAGRSTIREYYQESSYDCLSKFSNHQDTVDGFVKYLTQEVQINGFAMPKILSLSLQQGRMTIIWDRSERSTLPIIKLRFSEIDQTYTVNDKRSRQFLHYLGWVDSNRQISDENVAELFDISRDRNTISSAVSRIREAIINLIGLGVDKDFVDKYIFDKYRKEGFKLVDNIILEPAPQTNIG